MFSFLKKLFGRGVSLKAQQKREFVHFHKLKGGNLKTNTSIFVDSGFMAVIFHYDKLCDVLMEGEHKFTEMGMPILSRYNKPRKTRNGIVVSKKIKADIYFVNLKVMENFTCKISRIKAKFDGKNKKIAAFFSYDIQALNPSRLLYCLLLDMPYVKNTRALQEVGGHVKLSLKNLLNTNIFELEKFADKESSIVELLNSYINKTLSQMGIEVSNIKLLQIKMSKKLQQLYLFEKETKNAVENENLKNFIEKNTSEKNPEAIPVPAYFQEKVISNTENEQLKSEELPKEQAPEKPKEPEINFEASYQKYLEELEKRKLSENPPVDADAVITEPPQDIIRPDDEIKVEKVATPQKFCNYCGEKLPPNAKFCQSCGKSTGEYKICKSCGAKNFPNAKTCIFCKSELD